MKGRKTFRASVVTALCVLLAVSCLACGGKKGNNPTGKDDKGNTVLAISMFDGGYGTQWLENVGKVYMQSHKNVVVRITPTVLPLNVLSSISGGLYTCDLFLGTANLGHQYAEYFRDLTDLYEKIPDGETKQIKDKMSRDLYESEIMPDGKIYSMPWVDGKMPLFYNKTALDKVYAGQSYELPRTTEEFFKMAERIKGKGAYAYTTWNTEDYNQIILETMWSQYDADSYINYFKGQYKDENGAPVADTTGEKCLNAKGKILSLEFLEKLLKKDNGYTHSYSNAMDFMEAQSAWLGYGYGNDKKDVVFCVNGSWIEHETGDFMAASEAELRAMKMPVLSACIDNCTTVKDDKELSAVIKAIDEGSAISDGDTYTGDGFEVNKADYEYLQTARSFVGHVVRRHSAGIPYNAVNREVAEDFLTFMASDTASQICANELSGVTLPFGYMPDVSSFSDLTKSIIGIVGNDKDIRLTPMAYANSRPALNGLYYVRHDGWAMDLFAGTTTAAKLFSDDLVYYSSMWEFIMGK